MSDSVPSIGIDFETLILTRHMLEEAGSRGLEPNTTVLIGGSTRVPVVERRGWWKRKARPGIAPNYQSQPEQVAVSPLGSQRQGVWNRRAALVAGAVALLLLALVGLETYLFSSEEMSTATSEQVGTPAVAQEASKKTATGETTTKEEAEGAATAPEDPTLYLTVPRLGIQGHTVRNDGSEEALGLGAIKLPSTGFPWEKGDINTYITCHRLGFPGTESHNQCLNLPSMQQGDEISLEDANGTVYEYRVSEIFAVSPSDTWVTEPSKGRDVVSLQTYTETPNDWFTIGPKLIEAEPGLGHLIVRADRVG